MGQQEGKCILGSLHKGRGFTNVLLLVCIETVSAAPSQAFIAKNSYMMSFHCASCAKPKQHLDAPGLPKLIRSCQGSSAQPSQCTTRVASQEPSPTTSRGRPNTHKLLWAWRNRERENNKAVLVYNILSSRIMLLYIIIYIDEGYDNDF